MLIGIIAIGAVVAVLAVILALKALRFLLKLIRSSIMTQVIVTTILVAVIAMNWNLVDSHPIMAIVGTAIIVMLLISIAFEAYVSTYFKSKNFHDVKLSIAHHTENCNQLNDHIENLKSTFVEIASFDYGESSLRDTSGFKMKRRNWREHTKVTVSTIAPLLCARTPTINCSNIYVNISISKLTRTHCPHLRNC